MKAPVPDSPDLPLGNPLWRSIGDRSGMHRRFRMCALGCILNDAHDMHQFTVQVYRPMRTAIAFIVFTLALLSLNGCRPAEEQNKPTVVTSIAPLGDWVRQIGGAHLNVVVIVPPGASPHTFELRPQQLREAGDARLVVLMGAGLEYWDSELLANVDEHAEVLRLSEGHELLQSGDDHDHGHGRHGHSAGNPHLWLDPVFARQAVGRIAASLSAVLPSLDTAFTRRADAYAAELETLDREIAGDISSLKRRRFVGDHSSWVYFARRYGLRQEAVIEATPGREISARAMSDLINLMKRRKVTAIFANIRKSSNAADVLAEETGAEVALLDPLGGRQTAEEYVPLMRYNVKEMIRVLQ